LFKERIVSIITASYKLPSEITSNEKWKLIDSQLYFENTPRISLV
jgi:hypothetical protein